MLNDLRYTLRGLRRAPMFTAAAVMTLALAMAVNTIIFTLLNSLALRPMPVRDAAHVIRIYPVDANGRRQNLFSYLDYLDLAASAPGIDGMAAYIPVAVTASSDQGVREALAYAVSSTYFPVLGIVPSRGRSFSVDEETNAGAGRVTIISHSLWSRQFQRSEQILGQLVRLNGQTFTVVGVGSSRFMGTEPLEPDFWVPLSVQPIVDAENTWRDREYDRLLVVGRLAHGVTSEAAERSLSVVAARLGAAFPGSRRPTAVKIAPGTFFTVDPGLQAVVGLVFAIVSLVLVIACANIANLMLTRAAGRQREMAIRLALGASRSRLARYFLLESLMISVIGGSAGLLLSSWVLRLLYPVGLSLLPFRWASVVLDLTPDARVFGYTLLLSLATGVLFGIAPLLQTSTPGIVAGLRDDNALFGRRVRSSRIRHGLVVLQMAVCLMLLAGAALAVRALQGTETLDLGFDTDGVVHTSADVARHGYTAASAAEVYRRLTERAKQMPDVRDVAFTTHVPLTGGVQGTVVSVEGLDATSPVGCTYTAVSPGYFRTLGIPIVAGRDFTPAEAAAGAPAAIISEALARRFWPGTSALDKRLTTPRAGAPLTIVGVVRDAATLSVWRDKAISLYVPASVSTARNLHLIVRTNGDLAAVAAALRAEAAAYDRNLHFEAAPLAEVLKLWMLPSQVAALAGTVLGAIALMMAAVGVYGVIAYAVSQRTREIGVRIALGAGRADVRRLVLAAGARLITTGVALGLAGAAAMTRLVASVLPGARVVDPLAFGAAVTVLAAVAMAACYLPARAAAAVDPLVALRAE